MSTGEIVVIIIVGILGFVTLAITWGCMARVRKVDDEKAELNLRLMSAEKNAEMYKNYYLKEKASREEWRARYINKL